MIPLLRNLLLASLALTLAACGGDSTEPGGLDAEQLDNTQEVRDYYAAHPDFFSFKTLADLPDDLEWIDGQELPEIGSPSAQKGGTEYTSLQDFPRTLRTVGPDSNGSFRPGAPPSQRVRLLPRPRRELGGFEGAQDGLREDQPGGALVRRRADHGG